MRALAAVLIALALTACTSVGTNRNSRVTAGGDQELRLCIWLGKGVSEETAASMVRAWNDNEGARFGLRASYRIEGQLSVTRVNGPWFIKAHTYIPEGCDRNVALNGAELHRAAMEGLSVLLSSVPTPAKLGEATPSHMVVLAEAGSIMNVASTPSESFRHEVQHLLGCGHDGEKACLTAISDIKLARKGEFLPVRYPLARSDQKKHGVHIETSRENWNRILYDALWREALESQGRP